MTKVNLGFNKLNIPEKIQKARTIINLMTANTYFDTPKPPLADITEAVNALETTYDDAQDGGVSKKALMRSKEDVLDVMMSKLSAYIQDVSEGDEIIIQSSGMGIKSKATAAQLPETPMGLQALPRSNSGEAVLKWRPVKNAKTYLVEFTTQPGEPASWVILTAGTKAKLTATGLPSHTTIWFRVAAVGSKGLSQWSDPAKTIVA